MRLLVVIIACAILKTARSQTVYEKTARFSKFRRLLDLDATSLLSVYNDEVTVFAPVDQAFQKFLRKPLRNLASYHVIEDFHVFPKFGGSPLKSVRRGNPPLWVSERDLSVYINNALVLPEEFGYDSTNQQNRSQILYAVDQVLDPMVSNCENPTAFDFLKQLSLWTTNYTATNFFVDVIQNRLEDFFNSQGKYTFFIPIDDNDTQLNIHAIKAHVVPNRVLFTRPSEKAYWFRTLAADDYIKVFISMSVEKGKHLVVGETVANDFGDNTTVQQVAEIVFGNVPLQNGVAHLISKPLAVFPRKKGTLPSCELIDKFSSNPNLNTSYYFGMQSGFNENFNLPAKFTFFVPSNAGWDSLRNRINFDTIKRHNRVHFIRGILERHLVVGEIPVTLETLEKATATTCVNLTTPSGKVCLEVKKSGADYEVTWGGIRALVSRANYECADGLMHIINAPFIDIADLDEIEDRRPVNFVKIWKTLKEIL